MPDIPNFNMQPTFPIASVIDAAQRNNLLQEQAREAGNASLINGLKSIGEIGNSIYSQKMQMAQALAGAKLFAQSPEGQQMLAPTTTTAPNPIQPTVTTGPQGPVTPGQTATYDPTSQSITPNSPAMKTTSTPSPISMGDIQTAMLGESPSNMLTQLFNRQKERNELALKTRAQGFTEQMEPIKLAQQAALTSALTGVKGKEVSVQEQNNLRSSIATEEQRKQQAIKDFPALSGTFISGILPEGSNEQESAARKTFQDAQKNIDNYNRQLYGAGSSGGGNGTGKAAHLSAADLVAIVNQSK